MRARWLKADWSGRLTAGPPFAKGGIVPKGKAVRLDERDGFVRPLGTPEFVCPVCGAESWNPNDRRHGYCGRCHDYTGESDRSRW